LSGEEDNNIEETEISIEEKEDIQRNRLYRMIDIVNRLVGGYDVY